MKVSEKGRAFIQSFEKCRLTAYRDGGGVWTVGWGHTGPEVRPGFVVTQDQADLLFEDDLQYFECGVEDLVKVPISQDQFDALVSFAYNVGLDQDEDTRAEGLGDSTLLKYLNRGEYRNAAAEFLKWDHDNGKRVAGLTRRRIAERDMFLEGTS